MKADDLVILLEVARAGTLKAAADALGVNHTTVARRVRDLERRLGVPVIEEMWWMPSSFMGDSVSCRCRI